jgi:hypothetical protein
MSRIAIVSIGLLSLSLFGLCQPPLAEAKQPEKYEAQNPSVSMQVAEGEATTGWPTGPAGRQTSTSAVQQPYHGTALPGNDAISLMGGVTRMGPLPHSGRPPTHPSFPYVYPPAILYAPQSTSPSAPDYGFHHYGHRSTITAPSSGGKTWRSPRPFGIPPATLPCQSNGCGYSRY